MVMIRIALYSDDRKLQQLLSSALGKEFQVHLVPDASEVARIVASSECHVAVLDLDSNHPALDERLAGAQSIVGAQTPAVLLADDALRPTAMDLVRLGARSYCRKPPSVLELKTMLRRVHEASS